MVEAAHPRHLHPLLPPIHLPSPPTLLDRKSGLWLGLARNRHSAEGRAMHCGTALTGEWPEPHVGGRLAIGTRLNAGTNHTREATPPHTPLPDARARRPDPPEAREARAAGP